MGIQCFEVQSRAIFIIFGSESKRCPKLAINQLTSALFISNQFYWLKSLMGMESPPCRPPSYWLAAAGVVSESKRCFKSVENRAASSLGVGGHRYKSWFSVSNSYGFRAI